MGAETEVSCRAGKLLGRIVCILTYKSKVDIAVNYSLLIINLACCFWELKTHHENRRQVQRYAIGSFIFVTCFQITLCLFLADCSGISIIWCAMAGWSISERRRVLLHQESNETTAETRRFIKIMTQWVILADLAAIIYYWLTYEPITTVAHLCAIVMGAVISEISIRLYDSSTGQLDGTSQEPLVQT